MMKNLILLFLLLTIIVAVVFAASDNKQIKQKNPKKKRKLTSKDIGSEHNRICLQVGERIKQNIPQSKEEYIQHVREELLSLCNEYYENESESDISKCHNLVHSDIEESLQEDYHGRDYETLIEDILSNNIRDEDHDDEDFKNTLRDIYHSIFMLEDHSPSDVIMTINQIANDYEDKDSVDEWKKHVVLSTASVAVSSTELWTSEFFDPESGFYKTLQSTAIQEDGEVSGEGFDKRMLQTDGSGGGGFPIGIIVVKFSVTIISTILSDLVGGLVSGLAQFIVAMLALGDVATALTATIIGSINRSLMAFLSGTGLGNYAKQEEDEEGFVDVVDILEPGDDEI